MTTANIQAQLDRQVALTQEISRADALIATVNRCIDQNLNTKGCLSIPGAHGSVMLDLNLTKHLATNALQDLCTEQDALIEKLEAINTLLAD